MSGSEKMSGSRFAAPYQSTSFSSFAIRWPFNSVSSSAVRRICITGETIRSASSDMRGTKVGSLITIALCSGNSVINLIVPDKEFLEVSFPANIINNQEDKIKFRGRRGKFKSLILDKNFEEAKNLTLEELNEDTCKYMEGNPDEKDARFCGRKNVEKFSYCPLHLIVVFQPRGKKEDLTGEDEIPQFIEKKIKSA